MKSFEYQNVYKEAREFRILVSTLCTKLPKEEKYKLADRMKRTALSITAQIAEGFRRFHFQENKQFCRIARGSFSEMHEHLNVALNEGFIDKEERLRYITEKDKIMRLLNGDINYLRKAKTEK